MPFMYHYANRPGLSTQRSRQVIAEFFNTSTNGLPGNDGQFAFLLYLALFSLTYSQILVPTLTFCSGKTQFWLDFRCDGKLCCFLSCWPLSFTSNWANPALFSILPRNLVLQSCLQHNDRDPIKQLQRKSWEWYGRPSFCSGNAPLSVYRLFKMESYTKCYQRVTVNGERYKSNCYLDWDVFKTGAVVELTLSSDINVSCGNGADALPPSISTGGYN